MADLIRNKKLGLEYEVMETYDAGIELLGFEVKSVKSHKGSFEGSYAIVRGNEAFLVKMYIPPYQEKNTPEVYDPYQNRRLLLTKKELQILAGRESTKGLTIVPQSLYNKGRYLKVRLAVVRRKRKEDKREDIKKRESKREIERVMKRSLTK